jgi:hypothetical protein
MVKNLPTVERSTKIRFGKNCTDDQAENTIVFNASNVQINADYTGSVYMTPLRVRTDVNDRNITMLTYNRTTKEVMDSGAIAEDVLQFDLEDAVRNGNVTANTVSFNNAITSFTTLSNVGIANGSPIHTLDIGSNVAIDDVGSNVVSILGGNVYIQKDLIVDGNAQINGVVTVVNTENLSITDAIVELGRNNTSGDTTTDLGLLMNRPGSNVVIGFREGGDEIVLAYTQSSASSKTITPLTNEDIDVHVYGRVLTEANVGIINTSPIHTLDVGSNLYVDEFGSNILVVQGNTNVTGDLTVDTDTLYVNSVASKVGIKTTSPDAELHVVGNVYASSNLTVDEDTLHVDALTHSVGVETKGPDANLHVVGNVYVSSNLTVDTDTLHVDTMADRVGINTKNPDANLHVVGNVYVSSNLTVDTDTLHVDALTHSVGVETKNPDANLHVVGNVYVSSNLTADEDTLHVDALTHSVGVETKNPDANLHVVGNVYVTSNLTVDTDTLHVDTVADHVGINTKEPDAELHVVGNVYVSSNLTVDTDTLHVDTVADRVGINTKNPDANLHVVGNVYVSSNLTVDEDTLHVDALTHSVGIETKDPDANLHVVGNVYVSSNLTVDTDTLHVDTVADHVGINTKEPDAELHVVGNVYVSSNLTVDTDTLHVDALTHSVGVETKDPDANLHVVGNVYVTSNLTVDTDTLHVDALTHSVGVETKDPDANLHVVGNVYVTSNLTVDEDTLHVDALTHSVGVETKDPDANLHVVGNVYVTSNLTVDEDTLHVDALTHSVGVESKNPDANLHVVGNVYVSSNLTVDEDTLHVDALTHSVGIETKEPDANLHVVGNVYVSSNLTVDTDTLHVDALTHSVGIETKDPDANLHVVGNVYVTSNLTVDTDTLHVDALTHSVGIETKGPDANLHVVGNVYASSNLTVDTDTFHVNALTHSVGIETKNPDANLHVVGNVYVTSNLTVDTDTLHVDTVADRVGINTKEPDANLHVVGNAYVSNTLTLNDPTTALVTDLTSNVLVKLNQLSNVDIDITSATESLRSEHILVYDGTNWINDYPKHTYVKVYNVSGYELKTGNVVYAVGTHNANVLEVALAKADDPATMPAFGLVTSDIPQSGEGVAVTYGKAQLEGIAEFATGETVYVSNAYAGTLSNVKPFYTDDVPNLIQNVGIVTKSGGGTGSIFVTGVGRANDVPNAQIVEDEGDINWVYVNNVNNDFKKIVPSNLLTQLQTLEQVSAAGNNVSNIISFSNVTTGIVTTGNVQVGSNISVIGLTDPSNKYLPMVDTTGTFIKSPVYVTDGGKYVISASEAEFLGNITLGGNTTIISSTSVTIEDRIFGVGANNSTSGLDSGFMIEHQDSGTYANVALIYHADEHRFSIGHTQNTFSDDHILHYQDASGMLIDLRGNVAAQNNMTVAETITVTGASTLKDDLTVGLVSNLFVDVSTSRVGINEASPEKSLDVNGTGRFKDTTDSTTTSTGALIVSGGLGVASNIHSTNVYATTHMAVGTSPTSVPLEVRASGTDGILVKNIGETATDHAKLALEVTSGSGGDPYLTMKTNSTTFAAGVDNSDNDIFKISNGSALGTNDRLKITTAGITTVTNTTEATSTSTGALIVSGGLGVASNINVTNVYVLGTTAASSKTTGALQVRGGLGVQGSVYAASLHTDDYVSHIDDTNTRIGFPAVDTFVVETSGTERIRVDSVGRLGVGTTAPQAKLHVVGNAYVSSNLTVGASNLFVDTTSGRVGVGSASPNSNLHVVGNAYVSSNLTVGTSDLFVNTVTGRVGVGSASPNSNLHVAGNAYVSSNLTVGTSDFHVDTLSGHVGIGITNPDRLFHVQGDNAIWRIDRDRDSAALQFHRFPVGDFTTPLKGFYMGVNASASNDGEFFITDYGTAVSGSSGIRRLTIGNTGDVAISSNLSVGTAKFHVDTLTGFVGVGTTNPVYTLDVNGNARVGALTATTGTFSGDLAVGTSKLFVDVSTGQVGIGSASPNSNVHVVGNAYVSSNLTVGASKLFVNTVSGHVGVGSASPNSNLHVVGNVYVSSNLTVGASNFFVDTTTGGVGIGTNTPEYKLDVHGTSNVGVLTVSNATEATSTSTGALIVSGGLGVASNINATNVYVLGSTTSSSKTTGALQVTGGVGVGGSLYATELFTDENIVHTGDTDTYIGFPAADTFVVETNGNERLRVDSSGNIGINDSTPEYKLDVNGTGRFTGVLTGDAGVSVTDTTQATSTTTGALTVAGGISTQTNVHASNVYIAGGLVTNTGGVTKKTYSHTGTITSGTQPYMNVNFTNHIFYARITAQLVEGDEELSTMVLECGGGNKSGSSPTTNIALGTKNVFGGVSTNPWSSVVIAEPTRLAMIPSTALGGTGEYHIFIEYTSPNAGGGVTTIDEDTTAAVTFGY